MRTARSLAAALLLAFAVPGAALASGGEKPRSITYTATPPAPSHQTQAEADAKSAGCLSCHTKTDDPTMHGNTAVILGCTDCHGGDPTVMKPANAVHIPREIHEDDGHGGHHAAAKPKGEDGGYFAAQEKAHVQPRYPETWGWPGSANPKRPYTLLNKEAPEFIRFNNPADLRVAREACGACHMPIIQAVERSLMATGAMLWGGAAYNNGIVPYKNYLLGEAYTREGLPASIDNPVKVDAGMKASGVIQKLLPLPAWETIPPGDIFRVFERGGRNIVTQFPEIGNPNNLGQLQRLEEPGRPDIRQSMRGPGTGIRVAIPVLNITKTRLNDPFLWFPGTNDQPGDYRQGGCAACHVPYANDRDPRHSGPLAQFGHRGLTQTADPTIPKNEPGHPLKHGFTNSIPTSQCMICHMHQPNIFLNSMLGYTMWDYESDAPNMWPEKQAYPNIAETHEVLQRNPEGAAPRGKWGDLKFLENVWTDVNPKNQDTQFADYHGHGWNFRAIFKRDRKGNLLDKDGNKVANDDPQKFEKAVHMSSIHVDVGMHCVDCHFSQDAHGNGHIYGEVAQAIEITCKDCHGTADAYPTLLTSGPASPQGGRELEYLRLSDGRRRFEWRGNDLYQRSAMNPDLEWKVSLTKDTVTPGHAEFNGKAARAKLMSRDTASLAWGPGVAKENRAHNDPDMACFTCHLSWTTSCAGCHLPIEANWKTERHHYEGGETRNFATYNPQVARDDMFQLGKHGPVKGGQVAPIRSTSALILSSTNINRERIYIQQPPIAASGFSSQAFAPHYPHTERKTETKTCTDCHLSAAGDNNAIMAQLLLLGTNFVNFVGFNAWVGGEGGIEAVQVTEWDEPQAVIGSYLHRYAYPDWYKQHQDRGMELQTAFDQSGGNTGCIQMVGEYVYAAQGPGGTTAYDIASIANKGISDRILKGPFNALGHSTTIASKNATCVALPTNQPIAPQRNQGDLMRIENQEQPFHPIYHYAFITDSEEGLIAFDNTTLADGEARNNFFTRALTWDAGGLLKGARHITIGGHYFYIVTDKNLVVVDMNDPLKPQVAATVPMADPRATALQFRYLWVTTANGLETVDVTEPTKPRLVAGATTPLKDAQRVYLARTYAYVAAGAEGLAIVDVERPEQPALYQMVTLDGKLNDARDVIVATTNASLYAYVADGRNGLKVLQLTGPDIQPNFYGFSPEPKPKLIAWRRTATPATSLSKGLDRDRGVDETGHQMAIFGRIGSRPFTKEEMEVLYLDANRNPWTVTDEVRMQDLVPAKAGGQAAALPVKN